MTKVDVHVVRRTDFGHTQLARRQPRQVGQAQTLDLYVTSPEDTVLSKLVWYRQGEGVSDRQWRDVLGMLKVQGESLDRSYLEDGAGRLQVTELLRRAFDDAGLWPTAPASR